MMLLNCLNNNKMIKHNFMKSSSYLEFFDVYRHNESLVFEEDNYTLLDQQTDQLENILDWTTYYCYIYLNLN